MVGLPTRTSGLVVMRATSASAHCGATSCPNVRASAITVSRSGAWANKVLPKSNSTARTVTRPVWLPGGGRARDSAQDAVAGARSVVPLRHRRSAPVGRGPSSARRCHGGDAAAGPGGGFSGTAPASSAPVAARPSLLLAVAAVVLVREVGRTHGRRVACWTGALYVVGCFAFTPHDGATANYTLFAVPLATLAILACRRGG